MSPPPTLLHLRTSSRSLSHSPPQHSPPQSIHTFIRRLSTTRPHDPPPASPPPTDWELPRKILHASVGFLTLYLYLRTSYTVRPVLRSLAAALVVIAPTELLRFRSPAFAVHYERALGFLMRDSEKRTVNGVVWYILGVSTSLSLYPLDVAVVAILTLSWADTAASTLGRLLGAHSPRLPARSPLLRLPLAPRKSVAGFTGAALVGGGIAAAFWGWGAAARPGTSWSWDSGGGAAGLAVVGAVAGLVAGVAEALDLGPLDDNLTLPVVSGGCLVVLLWVVTKLCS